VRPALLALLAALALPAAARQLEAAPRTQAAHLTGTLVVDGRLDEPGWAAAAPTSGFVQSFPDEGAPPSERTEVRVLYDDHTLYVGIRCFDSRPGDIVRPLGRRDAPPASDHVLVLVDANLDRRTALEFYLSAGGVQADALVYDDERVTFEWDAVWDGAVAILADGWSAELAIPLSVLRFPDQPSQTWGFAVQRELGRSRERSATVLFPRSARGIASRLGLLTGIEGIRPGLDLEVTPYLAGRLSLQPPAPDAAEPRLRPRILVPVGTAGADFRARLGSSLSLSGALNPDFGQVEADQILLNLSGYEVFFPEKRPLFTHGLDLFQPVGFGADVRVPHQLFYSRRIGLVAPILGAVKLVGRLSDRVEIGLLDALVMGAGQVDGTTDETADRDRGLRWRASQPLQLSPGTAYPVRPPLGQNFLAGVLRWEAADRLVLGARATSALPLERPCQGDAAYRGPRTDCATRSGHAAALDLDATSADGAWYALGQVTGSRLEGPARLVLGDGKVLEPGASGLGAYLRLGRRGGEPWRFDLYGHWSSPWLDLNAMGFQQTQNQAQVRGRVIYTRPGGGGPFHSWSVETGGLGTWTTDGRGLMRGAAAWAGSELLLRDPYLSLSCTASQDLPFTDVRGIAPATLPSGEVLANPLARPGWSMLSCMASTDGTRAVSVEGNLYLGKNLPFRPLGAPWFHGGYANLSLRPHPRATTVLGATYDRNVYAIRHVGNEASHGVDDAHWLLGSLTAPTLSLVLRQILVLTPRLTFQVYAQLFTDYGRWGPLFQAPRQPDGRTVTRSHLEPLPGVTPSPDFHDSDLVVNAVLRWEPRPGSTLFVVYARGQSRALGEDAAGLPPRDLLPHGLPRGPTTDSVMVKWSWWVAP
jgi:hypothetical protein